MKKWLQRGFAIFITGMIAGTAHAGAEHPSFSENWTVEVESNIELIGDVDNKLISLDSGTQTLKVFDSENGEVVNTTDIETTENHLNVSGVNEGYIFIEAFTPGGALATDGRSTETIVYSAEGEKVFTVEGGLIGAEYGKNHQILVQHHETDNNAIELRSFEDEIVASFDPAFEDPLQIIHTKPESDPSVIFSYGHEDPTFAALNEDLDLMWEIDDLPGDFAPTETSLLDSRLIVHGQNDEIAAYNIEDGTRTDNLLKYTDEELFIQKGYFDHERFLTIEEDKINLYNENLEKVTTQPSQGNVSNIKFKTVDSPKQNHVLITDYTNSEDYTSSMLDESLEERWTSDKATEPNTGHTTNSEGELLTFMPDEDTLYYASPEQPYTAIHQLENKKLTQEPVFSTNNKQVFFQTVDEDLNIYLTALDRDPTEKSKTEATPADHEWTIELNHAVDADSVHKDNVYIKNEHGTTLNIEKSVHEYKIDVQPEDGSYAPGDYTLHVSDELTSENGTQLTKGVQHEFTVD
ncbi:hypothetical protein B0H94_10425 [Salsuginibacillus halophilus]|uniref:Ig-like domain-containing protein n=1 Tax=Salsuginibacillus halophilus TaxID=517424 RepID=A0A2P8HQD7_9BACI|nr:hypothetical protein [Salsuginibacillus halophilus]PSL48425.1 hypothetical protein B0H94_10425 [Salsuginibacillus halophilus]